VQEAKVGPIPPLPDVARFKPADPAHPGADTVAKAAKLLSAAKSPVILMGRVSRSEAAWAARVALAEKLQARVLTDIKCAAAFPTDHPLHAAPPETFLSEKSKAILSEADVVLALDWVDTAGTLKQAAANPKVILVSPDAHVHRGWSMDYQALPAADVYMMCTPDVAVPLFLNAVRPRPAAIDKPVQVENKPDEAVSIRALANAFNEATSGMDVCLTQVPLGWHGAYRHFRHPMDYIGANGGGGVGAGPGITVGAALALKGSARMVAGIVGDGDFLMGVTALWTATHYRLPCLLVVANNRSFYNDEMHQERVARERGRPVENKWIGQRIDEPDIDLAMMAKAQGAEGFGPVKSLDDLARSMKSAVQAVKSGAVAVVDVRVIPGYDTAMNPGATPARR
jgi:thiamine pyrophosphate-dependent acetolactate synthase large subunit-like protein